MRHYLDFLTATVNIVEIIFPRMIGHFPELKFKSHFWQYLFSFLPSVNCRNRETKRAAFRLKPPNFFQMQ